MRIFWFLFITIFISGCMAVRTYTVEKPRTDTGVEGNRGYLSGVPAEEPSENKFGDTRKVSVVEIEFGRAAGKSKKNKAGTEETEAYSSEEENIDLAGLDQEDMSFEGEDEEVSLGEAKTYVVQKNDTLQKISQKFYGTTRKWMQIYEYNKDVLKNPDKVYPGAKIKIPDLD